jgi:protein-disulfide isomerase
MQFVIANGMFVIPWLTIEAQRPPSVLTADTNAALDTLGHVTGSTRAPLEVIAFVDFGCSQCARFTADSYAQLAAEFVETGQVAWRAFPFVMGRFRHSAFAAEAAECAAEQGAFLRMHDVLLERQREWTTALRPTPVFRAIAGSAGLNLARFDDCVATGRMRDRVRANKALAMSLGIYGTPTFVINRRERVLGNVPADWFAAVLRERLGATAPQ